MIEANEETQHQQLCTFQLGEMLFGVDVAHVQEVLRYQVMTPIPKTSSTVRGLINLRGEIVTAIEGREQLGLPARGTKHLPMNVVIRTEDGAASLLVDEIGDVVEVDAADFEPPPERLDGLAQRLVQGVYKLDGQLLLLFDTSAALGALVGTT